MNNWLDKLERKFSRYAIPNLMTYIIILYVAGFVLNLINPTFYSQFLSLDAGKILQGQIWRIVTFIIQPPSDSLIFIVFVLYLYYMIGKQLEAAWGAFRFNLYFFSGMLFIVIGAILAYLLTGAVLPMDTWYLNLSLFFAFGHSTRISSCYCSLSYRSRSNGWRCWMVCILCMRSYRLFFRPTAEVSMAYIIRRMHLLRSSRS